MIWSLGSNAIIMYYVREIEIKRRGDMVEKIESVCGIGPRERF